MTVYDADVMVGYVFTFKDIVSLAAAAEEASMESIMLWSMRMLPL